MIKFSSRDMQLTRTCASVLLGFLTSMLFNQSECQLVIVHPDEGTTVTVSTTLPMEQCTVCTGDGDTGAETNCQSSLTLVPDQNVTLLFNCSQPPHSAFTIQITRDIECTTDTCSPSTGEARPDLFREYDRSLTWDLKVPDGTVLGLDFPDSGLEPLTAPGKCQDGYQYTVRTTDVSGEVITQTYCKNGSLSHLDAVGQSTVTLLVPQGEDVDSTVFTVAAKPMIKKSRAMSVTPDPNTIVVISRDVKGPECQVCVDKEPPKTCNPKELTLTDASTTSVEFTCPNPHDIFNVQIIREIDCTDVTCSSNIVQTESLLFPDFNRTFIWDFKVPAPRAFQLDFPETGMRQISYSETCPNKHTYHIITYQRTGPATVGTYCHNGTITRVQVLYKGRVSLEVPGGKTLEPIDFKVSVGAETDMLATIQVNLPRGVSNTDFITANYPRDLPNEQKMRWVFVVPGMHNYTVSFLDLTVPQCLKKEAGVEYLPEGQQTPTKMALLDPQPSHWQGSFSMTLQNCKTNLTVKGLTLKFRVSVMRSGHPVLCTVDLTQQKGVTLNIEKRGSDSYCEIRKDSAVTEKITVPSGTQADLSFLDCPSEDLLVTASETLECKAKTLCQVMVLTTPALDTCLPVPIQSFSWRLQIPEDGTVGLQAFKGTLQQSLPGQECNDTVSLLVTDDNGAIGHFCPGGTINKVQVRSSVSVTASAKYLSLARTPVLNATFTEEILENIVYTVNPRIGDLALIATPNWPNGMAPSTTVSWIVSLPDQYEADLNFVNISQPKCEDWHTGIDVQTLGSLEELLSRREDEKIENRLMVPESFYLNMSNCLIEKGQFSVLAKVTVQKKSNILLGIILGAVGALLLMLIVVAVVCVVVKKRKRTVIKEPSIYIGKRNMFLSGDGLFPKTRSDNDSHIYTYIDENMVYGHLLPDPGYMETTQDNFQGMPIDSYRTFTGQVDGPPVIIETGPEKGPDTGLERDGYRPYLDPSENFIPSRPRTPIDFQDSLAFEDRRMVDNELYTFKSIGDINKIRLSAELEPEPIAESDSEEEESL